MEPIFTIIVILLLALAISGLVVGVSNDAVNFLNSAIGSRVAPRYVILIVASAGIVIGAFTSSGMMEVARSGVFYPAEFNFREVMMLFLGVMFANVILLDLFNTFGLPTSTTVSLVFGLLGAAIAVASVKIWDTDTMTMADMPRYINSGKAMAIISAILVSVVLAFVCGSVVMFFTRLIFTFRYQKLFSRYGAIWCGFAFTAIVYFAVFKGLKGTNIIPENIMDWANSNVMTSLGVLWLASTVIMLLTQKVLKFNILRLTVLAGTFSLALAFAGNDLVNFIGVPIAGYDSYRIASATGDTGMMMGDLNNPVVANFIFLFAAGAIMVLTLWTSKKAKTVTETEINLSKQDEGAERFGSTLMSRSIVRLAMGINKTYEKYMPEAVQRSIERRFIPLRQSEVDKAPYDLIRATANLTVASLLISLATTLKLPLSTTYVTFMVAMGTSLADRAWGRESAVYRITGVLTVISGWFVTALIAFVIAYGVALILMYGGTVAVLVVAALCILLLIQSAAMHKKKVAKTAGKTGSYKEGSTEEILESCISEVHQIMSDATRIYKETLIGVFNEDRRLLKDKLKEATDLFYKGRDRKYEILPTLHRLQNHSIDTGQYYIQMVDYISEVTKALVHITRPCFEHIDNNHEGLTKEQMEDLVKINNEVAVFYDKINYMLITNDFTEIEAVLGLRDELFETMSDAMKNQIRRIKTKSSSTKASILYLNVITETKTMVLQSRNLLKSQRYFVENTQMLSHESE